MGYGEVDVVGSNKVVRNRSFLLAQAAEAALATLEAWMDRQPLSRTAQAPDKQKELAKLATQAQVRNGEA